MKIIAMTQRVDYIESYGERRDSYDQQWISLLKECGYIPLILPNDFETAKVLIEKVRPDGYLLTGGNNLEIYSGDAPERDKVEAYCIDNAIAHRIPVFGVCRGMQMLLDYFGSKLIEVSGHVATKHLVKFANGTTRIVNSFHSLGVNDIPKNFNLLAETEEGIVEAIKHSELNIFGIMWHPEREKEFDLEDIKLIRKIFN